MQGNTRIVKTVTSDRVILENDHNLGDFVYHDLGDVAPITVKPSKSKRLLNCDVASMLGRTAALSKGVRVGNLMIIHFSYTLIPHMCVPPAWWLVQLLSISWVMKGPYP